MNHGAPASSLELDLHRVRGVPGQGGSAGRSGTRGDRQRGPSRSPGSRSVDEEEDDDVGGVVPSTKKERTWNGEEYARTSDIKNRKWGEDGWAIIFSLFREYNLQRLQSKQEESTEEEEMKQQQRMDVMKDLIKKIRSKGRMDVKNRWWVWELLAKDCEKAWTPRG